MQDAKRFSHIVWFGAAAPNHIDQTKYDSMVMDMHDWCALNLNNRYQFIPISNYMLFDDLADATLWKLRWG